MRYAPLVRLGATLVLRRVALYLILFPIHFAISGAALAVIAVKASSGDTDAWFWLAFAWVALQALTLSPLMVLNGLALAFVAIEATKGQTGWIFWTCFAWLAAIVAIGGLSRRAASQYRRRRAAAESTQAGAEWGSTFAWFASSFGTEDLAGSGPGPPTRDPADTQADIVIDAASVTDLSDDPNAVEPAGLVEDLERLAALHTAGELSDEEYERAKRQLLE